jgi:glycosyltransferase involved in cell wall biosynthesis
VIVCDNATPGDENEKVIAAFKDKIPNLKYLKNPTNLGVMRNIMKTMEKAQGEFYVRLSDDDEISPRYVEASVKTLLNYPKAVCATPYFRFSSDPENFPACYMSDSWFRRGLAYRFLCSFGGLSVDNFVLILCMTRTSITRELMREATRRWKDPRNHDNTRIDDIFAFLRLCLGQAVPIADKRAIYTLYPATEKEYEHIGRYTDEHSFLQNLRDQFWMFSDSALLECHYLKIVYDRGGWRSALPFGFLTLVVLLHAAGSSLYQQIRGRWRKILGKEEITQS